MRVYVICVCTLYACVRYMRVYVIFIFIFPIYYFYHACYFHFSPNSSGKSAVIFIFRILICCDHFRSGFADIEENSATAVVYNDLSRRQAEVWWRLQFHGEIHAWCERECAGIFFTTWLRHRFYLLQTYFCYSLHFLGFESGDTLTEAEITGLSGIR